MENKIRTIYHRKYPGGLVKYLDAMADGFAGLERHGWGYTEEQKKHTLIQNLQFSEPDRYFYLTVEIGILPLKNAMNI